MGIVPPPFAKFLGALGPDAHKQICTAKLIMRFGRFVGLNQRFLKSSISVDASHA